MGYTKEEVERILGVNRSELPDFDRIYARQGYDYLIYDILTTKRYKLEPLQTCPSLISKLAKSYI